MRRKASRHAPAPSRRRRRLVGLAAVRAAELERARELVLDGVVGGLEAEHEHRALAVAGAGLRRLERVDEPAVGGPQAGLDERAHRLGAGQERREAHRAPGAVRRARLHAHPRLGDDAEGPLRAEQHPVGRRAGARAGQPPRRPRARSGVIARTASTRSSTCVAPVAKCPPARVAIQPPSVESSKDCGKKRMRQPVRAELLLQARARRRPRRCAPRARPGRPRATRSSAPRSSDDRAVEASPGSAARRRRRRSCRRRRG